MSKRRVVVTGLGIVSPVGNDIATAWSNITAGKSGRPGRTLHQKQNCAPRAQLRVACWQIDQALTCALT